MPLASMLVYGGGKKKVGAREETRNIPFGQDMKHVGARQKDGPVQRQRRRIGKGKWADREAVFIKMSGGAPNKAPQAEADQGKVPEWPPWVKRATSGGRWGAAKRTRKRLDIQKRRGNLLPWEPK